jgi:AcrR family transcriptional regulator
MDMLTLSTLSAKIVFVKKKEKPPYHHGNLRAALIASGVELIEENGVRALTLREIGARVGVSRSAAYRHFADKAALLAAIREAGFIEFEKVLKAAKEGAGDDFARAMDAMGMAYVRFAEEHRAHFDVMFHLPPDQAIAQSEAGARAFAILQQTIREGQQSGQVREGDPTQLARAVWSLTHGVSMLRLKAESPEDSFIQFGSEVLRTGLAKRDC